MKNKKLFEGNGVEIYKYNISFFAVLSIFLLFGKLALITMGSDLNITYLQLIAIFFAFEIFAITSILFFGLWLILLKIMLYFSSVSVKVKK